MRWGFNDGVCQNYGRLECDAVHSGKRVEEFQRILHLVPNVEAAGPIEMSV